MARRTSTSKLDAEKLKTILWETMQEVKSDSISTQKANAVCSGARQICSVVRLELQMAKLMGTSPNSATRRFVQLK